MVQRHDAFFYPQQAAENLKEIPWPELPSWERAGGLKCHTQGHHQERSIPFTTCSPFPTSPRANKEGRLLGGKSTWAWMTLSFLLQVSPFDTVQPETFPFGNDPYLSHEIRDHRSEQSLHWSLQEVPRHQLLTFPQP